MIELLLQALDVRVDASPEEAEVRVEVPMIGGQILSPLHEHGYEAAVVRKRVRQVVSGALVLRAGQPPAQRECDPCSSAYVQCLSSRASTVLIAAVRARCGRPLAPGDQWRDGGQAVGEQLTEGAVRELRGAEDVGDPLPAREGIRGRDAAALRAGRQLVDAAPLRRRRG